MSEWHSWQVFHIDLKNYAQGHVVRKQIKIFFVNWMCWVWRWKLCLLCPKKVSCDELIVRRSITSPALPQNHSIADNPIQSRLSVRSSCFSHPKTSFAREMTQVILMIETSIPTQNACFPLIQNGSNVQLSFLCHSVRPLPTSYQFRTSHTKLQILILLARARGVDF